MTSACLSQIEHGPKPTPQQSGKHSTWHIQFICGSEQVLLNVHLWIECLPHHVHNTQQHRRRSMGDRGRLNARPLFSEKAVNIIDTYTFILGAEYLLQLSTSPLPTFCMFPPPLNTITSLDFYAGHTTTSFCACHSYHLEIRSLLA